MFDLEALKALAKPQTTVVKIANWGGAEFTIRKLSGTSYVETSAKMDSGAEHVGLSVLAIIDAAVDPETGVPLFTADSFGTLMSFDLQGILEFGQKIADFNKIVHLPIEEVAKNSEAIH